MLDGKRLVVDSHGQHYALTVDEILVGVGRAPNLQGLGLEKVGVNYDGKGIAVNDRLQTTNPRIYAAGDVCSRYKFTHAADAMAQLAGMDSDRAREENGVGFAKSETAKGHAVAAAWTCTGRLTDDEFAWARKMAVKYRRQVGSCERPSLLATALAC